MILLTMYTVEVNVRVEKTLENATTHNDIDSQSDGLDIPEQSTIDSESSDAMGQESEVDDDDDSSDFVMGGPESEMESEEDEEGLYAEAVSAMCDRFAKFDKY